METAPAPAAGPAQNAPAADQATAVAAPTERAPRKPTARGLISRDRLIEATLELLADGGYPALSIAAVCKRAGVSAASLYHHFGDKAGLIAATLDHAITQGARRFAALIAEEERPTQRIDVLMTATLELARDRVNDPIATLAALAEATSDAPELAEAVAQARRRAWRVVAGEIGDLLGVRDSTLLVHLYYAFTTYMAHVVRTTGSKDDAKALFKSLCRVAVITVGALRPALYEDPAFAAAWAEASRDLDPAEAAARDGAPRPRDTP